MPEYRSNFFKKRHMAGARALWRATGAYETDKPLIAVVNSYSEFVAGHVHLNEAGAYIKEEIIKAGGIPKEFNTIAIDDGIAMGHDGMLYSLPSRDLIADSVEYVVNAHRVDAMICVTNCDKITPGMLMASMRLNIPTIFVSGGPMEAGKGIVDGKEKTLDLVDIMVAAGDENLSDKQVEEFEEIGCPTCGSCSGMFTANSMNCLTEALGLGLPGNGTLIATHKLRKDLMKRASHKIVEITKDYYENDNAKVLPRSIATRDAFLNAMKVDLAIGGSTNTVLHLLAIANEAGADFAIEDINELSKTSPNLCKVSPSSKYHMEDVHLAGGIWRVIGELAKKGILNTSIPMVHSPSIAQAIEEYDINNPKVSAYAKQMYSSAPKGIVGTKAFSHETYAQVPIDEKTGCIRSVDHAYSQDGGLAVLFGNLAEQGCVVKSAGVKDGIKHYTGRAIICESQEEANARILGEAQEGDVVVIRYEGPKGGPGMQEMLYPTSYLISRGIDHNCALITDGRFSGGSSGLSVGHISPEAGDGGIIALVEEGDMIEIDIPNRSITLKVSDEELAQRRKKEEQRGSQAYTPKKPRERAVSKALQLYAKFATNASKGGVREI